MFAQSFSLLHKYICIIVQEYPEFRKKFAKEIQTAFESYRRTQLNKYSYNFKGDNSNEFNFYNKGAKKKPNLFGLF